MDYAEAFSFTQQICAELARGVSVFPTSFDTTLKLRNLLQSEHHSTDDIVRLLQKDPLLSAKIVQASNSAALNPGGARAADLKMAVSRLGIVKVRMLALSLAMRQFLAYKEMERFAHRTEPLITRSREVAACAQVIAREHTRLSPDMATFAGLIQDLGAFYLLYRLAGLKERELDEHRVDHLLWNWCGDVSDAVFAALDVPMQIRQAIARYREPRPVPAIGTLDDLLFVCKLLVGHRAGDGSAILDADEIELIPEFDLYLATLDANQAALDDAATLF